MGEYKLAGAVKSLDEIEKEYWNPKPSMLESPTIQVALTEGKPGHCPREGIQPLDGLWEMAEGGAEEERCDPAKPWKDAISAGIPGSVHTALYEAGIIPDPLVGLNDKIAREYCYKEWWFKKEFTRDHSLEKEILRVEGICYRARIWLNGVCLGTHSGMFGTPEYPIEDLLQDRNILIVKIDNAPARPRPLSDFMDNDEGWHDGVVINCVYGWHYVCLPSRGIWAPVRIYSGAGEVTAEKPLVAAADAQQGIMDICVKVNGRGRGTLSASVAPKNFEGKSYYFDYSWDTDRDGEVLHFQIRIPEPRLWWPNNHGSQNLYTFQMSFLPEGDRGQFFESSFGIRTITMAPLPGGPYEDKHNWTYVINGKKIFVKGANWCTLDVLLRFSRENYDRFLDLARRQNIQLLRAWGGGMPESDDFYDLCDEYGIMVMQEWPTCWDSQKEQPYQELEDTVLCHMPRLRNHPSLIMWCGGNESKEADGAAMDMMARYAFELDGSRPFHRTSPWGGALHDYSTYWERMDIDVSLQLKSHFMGEFGMASAPNYESVLRYLPEEEKNSWPPDKYGSFAHHTPRFNQFDPNDMDYLSEHALEFAPLDTMEKFIWGTQIAQATGIRHTLEAYRCRWPESTGICYYKLTDVYPACSWSTIDYYGVPKLSYYVLGDSYSPLHACVLFQSTRVREGLEAPVYLLDDADELRGSEWKVCVRAYNEALECLHSVSFPGRDSIQEVKQIGSFCLEPAKINGRLLLIVAEIRRDGILTDRTFYWLNYHELQGCLLELPATRLSYGTEGDILTVRNEGDLPAVGVTVECTGEDTAFVAEDSVFWLEPGESRRLKVNRTEGLLIKAFNSEEAHPLL